VGIGQLTSYIAKKFGITSKDRLDPYKNMDASLGFMDYLNKKYKGDKAKMAVAYNQGEPVLDEHLKQNKGQLVPDKLHENVKTANKQEPANYLKKMNEAGALAPVQTAEAGTREAPRTPEMLERQKRAVRNRELLASLPIGEARASEEKPASKKGEFFPASMLNPSIGKSAALPKTKEGKAAPEAVMYSRPEGIPINPTAASPQTVSGKSPGLAAAAAAADVLGNIPAGIDATIRETLLAPFYSKEERKKLTSEITGQLSKPVGRALGVTEQEGYKKAPTEQAMNYIGENLGKADTELAKLTGMDVDDVRLARENIMLFGPQLARIKAPVSTMPKLPGKGTTKAADVAAADAAAAQARAAEAQAKVAAPRLPAPTEEAPGVVRQTPAGEGVLPTGEAEAARQRGLAGLAEDINATKQAERAAQIAAAEAKAAEAATPSAARTIAEKVATPASLTGAAITGQGVEPTDIGIGAPPKPHVAYSEEPGYDFSKPEGAEKAGEVPIEERGRTAEPEKKTGFGALTDEDWMMMGLNMLQAPGGQAGNALSQLAQNIGRSGLATLGAKREREKTAAEQLQKQALSDYYRGMTAHLGQEPEQLRTMRSLMGDPKLMQMYSRMKIMDDITGAQTRLIAEFNKARQLSPDLSWDQFLQGVPQEYLPGGNMGLPQGVTVTPRR
jgi:hypothetical protein